MPPGLGVVAACWTVQQLPALPPAGAAWALAALGAGLLAAAIVPGGGRRTRALALLLAGSAVLAGALAVLRAHDALSQRLTPDLEGLTLRVVGVVEEMPLPVEAGWRFRFRIERCEEPEAPCPRGASVRLAWNRGFFRDGSAPVPEVLPGERRRLEVRLKRPHALLNPGLFDAELRSLEEGIAGTGYVRAGPMAPLDGFAASPSAAVQRARTAIRARVLDALDGWSPAARGVVAALVVGDQAAIPGGWWEVFNRTGVGHLMSISGLHITMLAAVGGAAGGGVWRSRALARRMRRPLPALMPTPYARWAFGLATAFGYAALAGWGIPAQRTCWMLAAAGLALLSGRARSTLSVVSTAAAVVCVLDPWAPLAAGFWLSFAAVGAIVWAGAARGGRRADSAGPSWHARARAVLAEAVRSQWAATLSLLPLGVAFFSSVSLVGPLANAFAIPLVSFAVTPLALAGAALACAWPAAGAPPLAVAAWLTEALLAALEWLDGGGSAVTVPLPDALALLLASAACALLLAPMRLPGRGVAAAGLAPLLLAPVDAPGSGELRVTALDIGQGTAVLLETAHGRLLYDAGPRFGADNDAGARVIVPWLRSRGIDRLQALVVSHLDLDHSGGALAVLRNLRVDWVASSLPAGHPIVAAAPAHHDCRRGERWRWGEVEFAWLHPGPVGETRERSPTNARSCVLRVRSPAGSVLLAGDIEAAQERRLIELFGADGLRAEWLLAPHHGSATSSSQPFLEAVSPRWAVFQVGYRNRYRHPNAAVAGRYEAQGVEALRSDAHGAISLRMRPGREPQIVRARLDDARYWRVRVETAPSRAQALLGGPAPVDAP